MQKTKKGLFPLTASAVMIAMSIILCRYLGFSPQDTMIRFEIGFLPIAIVAYTFGPVYSTVSYVAADVIGSLFSGYAPNVWITAAQAVFGFIMGLFFHNKKMSLPRISLVFLLISALVEVLLKAPVFIHLYGYTPELAYTTRALNAALNLPLRILLLYGLMKALDVPLKKFMKKQTNNKREFAAFANSFQAVTVPGLERIGALCDSLGNPERDLRFIHIAGTNGKGSTSAAIAAILEDAGYKVGKFISPNLIKVNERISINGEDISDGDLEDLLSEIEPHTKKVASTPAGEPTQFEIWCAAALMYFRRCAVDYVVFEVGLGGELDATNVIPKNEIAIITRLGIDHTGYLGNTLADIARAKAGILKADSTTKTVITVEQAPEAFDVIKNRAETLSLTVTVPAPRLLEKDGIYERFYLDGIGEITCGISGLHQVENASLAAEAARALGISGEHIISGIKRSRNPARFELIDRFPDTLYDGGHNENGIEALVRSLDRYYGECEKTVVFACMHDKDIALSLKMLASGIEEDGIRAGKTEFIFTTVKDNPRADTAESLAERAEKLGYKGYATNDIGEAYERARSRGVLTVICGSLYLYKDLSEYLKKKG